MKVIAIHVWRTRFPAMKEGAVQKVLPVLVVVPRHVV